MNTYLETTYKLEGVNVANSCFQDKELTRIIIFKLFMFKHVEIFRSLKRVRGFAPNGYNNVRQRHLACGGFAEGTFNFRKLPLV